MAGYTVENNKDKCARIFSSNDLPLVNQHEYVYSKFVHIHDFAAISMLIWSPDIASYIWMRIAQLLLTKHTDRAHELIKVGMTCFVPRVAPRLNLVK